MCANDQIERVAYGLLGSGLQLAGRGTRRAVDRVDNVADDRVGHRCQFIVDSIQRVVYNIGHLLQQAVQQVVQVIEQTIDQIDRPRSQAAYAGRNTGGNFDGQLLTLLKGKTAFEVHKLGDAQHGPINRHTQERTIKIEQNRRGPRINRQPTTFKLA